MKGFLPKEINTHKGLKQGDHLTFFLFCLVAEGLGDMFPTNESLVSCFKALWEGRGDFGCVYFSSIVCGCHFSFC